MNNFKIDDEVYLIIDHYNNLKIILCKIQEIYIPDHGERKNKKYINFLILKEIYGTLQFKNVSYPSDYFCTKDQVIEKLRKIFDNRQSLINNDKETIETNIFQLKTQLNNLQHQELTNTLLFSELILNKEL